MITYRVLTASSVSDSCVKDHIKIKAKVKQKKVTLVKKTVRKPSKHSSFALPHSSMEVGGLSPTRGVVGVHGYGQATASKSPVD